MEKMDRRKFLAVVGAGSGAVAASAALSGTGLLRLPGGSGVSFRAVAGLPGGALPSYASYVVTGNVDLAKRTGVVTKAVYAGYPAAMTTTALPQLSQVVRVTDVRESFREIEITGVVDDRSQLGAGEDPIVHIHIDRYRKLASTQFRGQSVELRLQT